ncbi:hypothetical protein A2U01_0033883, partial [Trifolium medium]|nr:hypothetical protein [Trifolium medium]
ATKSKDALAQADLVHAMLREDLKLICTDSCEG